jgi:hypothetical protein
MPKRKRHIRPAPWFPIEWMTAKFPKGTPRRHYIAVAIADGAEYVLHSRKGWRRFSRRQTD